ncbi:MAG: ABC transporter ATP-binding protein [Bacilli bacterium]
MLNNICKNFDENVILKDINLTLESGKIYGFVGRNGSGKSVLLKIICGFYKPTSGEIVIDGINIVKENSFLLDTRVLIEKPTFLPNQSGFENLKLLAEIQGKINSEKINEVLDNVNLSKEDRHKNFHKYSLGMKQKLDIAQVLMEEPKIMIFDEPFNGIEEDTINKIRNILLEEKNKDKIIIIATHIKEDINYLVDILYKFDNATVKIQNNF